MHVYVRVYVCRKIAKPVLAHVVDMGSQTDTVKELQLMLKSPELAPSERRYSPSPHQPVDSNE
jgi:hypothetical protein